MNEYQQVIENKSIVRSLLEKPILEPVTTLIPKNVTPLKTALVTNLFLYAAFLLTIFQPVGQVNYTIIAVLILIYSIGNILSLEINYPRKFNSVLSIYIDHLLRSINLGLFIYVLLSLLTIKTQWAWALTYSFSFIVSTVKYYVQFKTGTLTIEKLGLTEATIVGGLAIFLMQSSPLQDQFQKSIIFNISLVEYALILISIVSIFVFSKALKRSSHVTYGIWLFIIAMFISTICGSQIFSAIQLTIVCTLYASWYVAKLLTAHLINGIEQSTGLFTPLIIITGLIFDMLTARNVFIVVVAYIVLNLLLLCYKNLKIINSKKENK